MNTICSKSSADGTTHCGGPGATHSNPHENPANQPNHKEKVKYMKQKVSRAKAHAAVQATVDAGETPKTNDHTAIIVLIVVLVIVICIAACCCNKFFGKKKDDSKDQKSGVTKVKVPMNNDIEMAKIQIGNQEQDIEKLTGVGKEGMGTGAVAVKAGAMQ